MTEFDAWLLVLDLVTSNKRLAICHAIKLHLDAPTLLRVRMLGRLRDNKPADAADDAIWWPLSENGRQRRIEFVKLMIEQSEDEPPLDFFTVDVGS